MRHLREMRNSNKILVRKAGGKRPFLRLRYRWEGDINLHSLHMIQLPMYCNSILLNCKPRVKSMADSPVVWGFKSYIV